MSNVVPDEPCARDEGIDGLLGRIEPDVARLLEAALEGRELTAEQGLRLAQTQGSELHALVMAADEMRRRQVGEVVTYVVNRNINFTNVCIKHCAFCAFSRDFREEEGYFLPLEEVVRRAKEAWELGATEICIQAGLPPQLDGRFYIELCRAIKQEVPQIHIHAFSPEEILYGSRQSGIPIPQYLMALKEAGLDTLPGTSAEILDDEIRDIISRGRITSRQWIEVITTAHALGIPTTATIMYGHIEQPIHWIRHMALLRDIQKETGGFTEFVPLRLIHHEAPIYRHQLVKGVRQEAAGNEAVKVHALARLMLGATFKNIQSSWVKEGPKLAQYLLTAGANDLGGTLINESISTSAGAPHGEFMPPAELRRLIRELGRVPAQRSTTYQLLRVHDGLGEEEGPLDLIDDPAARFGSHRTLAASHAFRYGYAASSRGYTEHEGQQP
ncbi:5-amino-6-(D-ribitylamino)uracil--L-tyrosine 4-hydroxyphenyl transferase CofH [Candidatus Methylomirabilis sp.]|uniref:5-amino-6-(D-ribitylamino)uracil--L-tyrosine 4-hydroxyphenyl transferase CofH n=1 Tax=Candidatus Methylomirabilis sp. TaxID=2032687 RepID=UPI002A5B42EC|nr:5-amino-6-(D-ribitylamino)uracil--L-tyrosine 4-hydroxyphenyl transferase CofH [Candidatus Methylomirabilis sp.]